MKTIKKLLGVVFLSGAAVSMGLAEPTVGSLYQEGIAAMKRGDADLAKAKFSEVLEIDPSHGNARYQLIRLRKDKDSISGLARKNQLTQITLDEVDLRAASLQDSIDYLSQLISDKNGGKTMNFIIQDPSAKLSDKKISLNLKGIPASVALDYILKAARAKVNYRKHAIEITPQP